MIQTLIHHFNKIGMKRPIDTSNDQTPPGLWQEPPQEIIEKIVQHLDMSTDRTPLRFVSRSWRSVAIQKSLTGAPQLPWLVHPHSPNSKYLSFTSLSDGKIHKLRLPEQIQGGWYFGSSKGWLIIVKEEGLDSEIYLLNPISGDTHKLPSFKLGFVELTESYDHEAGLFFDHIELSSSDISSCLVAAVFDCDLGLCRPGDKSWSVSKILYEHEYFSNILFSCGMLYALVNNEDMDGVVSRTLEFEDYEVEVKLVYDMEEVVYLDPDEEFYVHPFFIPYLLESANNEILLVHRPISSCRRDLISWHEIDDDDEEGNEGSEDEGDNNNEEEEEEEEEGMGIENQGQEKVITLWEKLTLMMKRMVISTMEDMKTLWETLMGYNEDEGNGEDEDDFKFRVYKIGSDNHNLVDVENLGDQILVLADQGSSFSYSTTDLEELEGNCIYFGSDNGNHKVDPHLEFLKPNIARDLDAFYLIDRATEPSFPNLNMPIQLFTPIL